MRRRPTRAEVSTTSRGLGRRPKRGVLVCDVYEGSYPRLVSHAVRLPRTISLVVRGEGKDLPPRVERHERTPPHLSEAESTAEHLDRDTVVQELESALAADALRSEQFIKRAAEHRVKVRGGLRSSDASDIAARSLHASPRVRVPSGRTLRRADRRDQRPRLAGHRARVAGAQGERSSSVSLSVVSPVARLRRFLGEFLSVSGLSLLVGILLITVASLSAFPRTLRALSERGGRAEQIFETGVTALFSGDARASAEHFREAGQAFALVAADLQTATGAVHRLVSALASSPVSAAQKLLKAGQRLTVVGTRAAYVLALFQQGDGALTEILERASPELETMRGELAEVLSLLRGIPLSSLPVSHRQQVQEVSRMTEALDRFLSRFVQSRDILLELLGSRQDRQYLILFQNHRELRPSGGFIGSFALVDMSRGRVRKTQVDTIYNPDGQLKDFLAPPKPFTKITDRWYTRDANWFADFRDSARKVAQFFERSGGPTVDGVIGVTPVLLLDLLKITGPIPMPAYGLTVSADNVLQETQRLVTYEYDRAVNQPKAFVADLLPALVDRVVNLPKEKWGDLSSAFLSALRRKHLLVYLRSPEAERGIVSLGWGGALPALPPSNQTSLFDHLGRVEANIGGHKTDDLVEQEVGYDVTVDSLGQAVATLLVTRHHRGQQQGTLGLPPEEDPQRKTNIVYERTLVPRGSTLLEARGFARVEDVPAPYLSTLPPAVLAPDPDLEKLDLGSQEHESGVRVGTEAGYTSFGGWIMTPPRETVVTLLKYRLPFRVSLESGISPALRYELFLTQQPGHAAVRTRATFRAPPGYAVYWVSPSENLEERSRDRVSFGDRLDHDAVWGVVLERSSY